MPPEPQPEQAPTRAAQLRELLGLLALLLGAAALIVPAFATDWRLGCALLGAGLICGGYLLTVEEEQS
jgi:uncharacterized membrane protein HdeD (DUF308 family)